MYRIISLFFIYAFLGWCVEVIYAGVSSGKFVNRGFMNGPVCPIYGVGAIAILCVLDTIKDNFIFLCIGSMAITSFIELMTGLILKKIFNRQWWDYSNEPYNLGGYICLKFSFMWMIACVVGVDIVHPIVIKIVELVSVKLWYSFNTLFCIIFALDMIDTVITMADFSRKLAIAETCAEHLRNISDDIGEALYGNVVTVEELAEKIPNLKEKYPQMMKLPIKEIKSKFAMMDIWDKMPELKLKISKDKFADIEETKNKIKKLKKTIKAGHRRLYRAFPFMKMKYGEMMDFFREKISGKNDES